MRKVWMALLVGVAVTAFLAGCGRAKEAAETAHNAGEAAKLATGQKATFKSDQGDVTMQVEKGKNSDEVTVKTKDAKGNETTYRSAQAADLSNLGIEVFPGAQQEHSGTVTNPQIDIVSAEYSSTDSFNKVAQFYKDKYQGGVTQEMSTKDGKTLTIQTGSDNDLKMIIVSEHNGQTHIILQHHIKKGGPPAAGKGNAKKLTK
jgi:hypothetical protein